MVQGQKGNYQINIRKIKELAQTCESSEDLAMIMGLKISTMLGYAVKENIKLPPFRNKKNRYRIKKRNAAIDTLIEEARLQSKEEIGNALGYSRGERIRQYLVGTNQEKVWEQNKKERKRLLENIMGYLQLTAERNTSEKEKFAFEKTNQFFSTHRQWDYDRFFSLYGDYYEFQEQNQKVPLKWFAKKYDLPQSYVGRVFKSVGIKTLARPQSKKREVTSAYKKQCLDNAVEVALTAPDIAYFINVEKNVAEQFFYKYYKGDKKRPSIQDAIKKFRKNKVTFLTYQLTSKIYEARDAGFSQTQIKDAYNIEQEVYDYVMKNETVLAKHIKTALKKLFPDQKINRPYREFTIK